MVRSGDGWLEVALSPMVVVVFKCVGGVGRLEGVSKCLKPEAEE
jgi:hypothetical protein